MAGIITQLTPDQLGRFWSSVERSPGCWMWKGSRIETGYGRFNAGQRILVAHRVAYELLIGPIPEGLQLDHLCRNRRCVNPAHLEPVTPQDNIDRAHSVRTEEGMCKRGHLFVEDNVYLHNGRRHCRTCRRENAERASTRSTEGPRRASGPIPKKNPANGKWWFVFDSQYPKPDGSRRQVRRSGFASLKEAKAELFRLREIDRPAGNLTVGQVLDRFVRAKAKASRAPNTVRSYRDAAARAKELWGGWPAEQLTGDHLDDAYTQWLATGKRSGAKNRATIDTGEGLSPRSVEIVHITIKAAYAMELRRRDTALRWNPANDVTPPAVTEQKQVWWTPEQVAQFLVYDAAHDDLPTGLVDMLSDVGGRRGEILAIRWRDVDLDAGTVTITRQFVLNKDSYRVEARPPKRRRAKATLDLHPATVAKLRLRRREQAAERLLIGAGWPSDGDLAHDLVFAHPDGRMILPGRLTEVIISMSVEAGLPRLTPHGLRHSFATAALVARVPVEVVAHRLGNSVAVVQQVYQHVIPSDDAAAARTVGDLFRPAKG